jgi:hypothetical protein
MLGCCFGVCALVLAGFCGVDAYLMWKGRQAEIAGWHLAGWMLMATAVCVGATYLCIKAALALWEARRWAAYVAMFFGVLFLWLSEDFFRYLLHMQRTTVDDGYVILSAPFLLAVGLWWCIYLNLPHVRAHFRQGADE